MNGARVSGSAFDFLGQVDHLPQVMVNVGGAAQKHSEAVARVFQAFGGIGGHPIRGGLPGNCVLDCDHGVVKGLQQVLFSFAAGFSEFKLAVALISGIRDLRANVITQIASEMEQEVANAVTVRIRPAPDLVIGKRSQQRVDFLGTGLVVAAEIHPNIERQVCHFGMIVLGQLAIGNLISSQLMAVGP